jgi:hypothetical protein
MTPYEVTRLYREQHPGCRQNEAARAYARYREWLIEYKSHPCSDCGGIFPPECMDFDHVRGEKLFAIGEGSTVSRERVEIEIAKCDLICSNCHRIRTRQRGKRGKRLRMGP